VDDAIDRVFAACPEALSGLNCPPFLLEDMYAQCMERVPPVVIDEVEKRAYVNTVSTEGIEAFYEMSGRAARGLCYSEKAAPGLYRFLERLPEIERGCG